MSPLKALSNDIQKNLATPLQEIGTLAEELGTHLSEIRAMVRTGDTKTLERQRMAKRPPHILITTPESLYILLTSRSGRRGLKGVRTLILDEVHAVADDKRGSHLSLSVERLRALAEGPVTRIGLSATQRPIEEMARFLVGNPEYCPRWYPQLSYSEYRARPDLGPGHPTPPTRAGPHRHPRAMGRRPWTPSPIWFGATTLLSSSSIPGGWWNGCPISDQSG